LDPPAIPAPLSEMEDVMLRAAKKGIPMVVANPDEVTVDGRDLQIMPGEGGCSKTSVRDWGTCPFRLRSEK
jgi:hypothetical protein